jgi:DNA primase
VIPRNVVDQIIDAAHVEEVVGEFVTLKKRGANLLGLCPFHGEKTPSFTVSPVKGFYKCFGCGKAGSSVNFIMEHLQLSYPEALKWLARKYAIEIVEREITPEEREQQTEKESMLIVMQFAQRYFTEVMNTSDEGRSVGRGYFSERGLRDDIIEKFHLGYSLTEKNAFTKAALKNMYQGKYLVKTGMSILSNRYVEGAEITANDLFDRYAGRVMFPIHDDGGRVVAFGGRTLSSDKKVAKYINSPETEIYNKSRILYGLWQAKKAMQEKDNCYLVEGYMDVIAMHQKGIPNVVASSGTSLTIDQIKIVHRFTRNIVVLYDGDEAGQKASNRAIPLLLEEGMNVKLLQFPDNDDPDSYGRKVSSEEFLKFIEDNATDFLHYKAQRLMQKAAKDPIKKSEGIRDIVENIAVIPDGITRSVYIQSCSQILDVGEQVLQQEVARTRRKLADKKVRRNDEPVPEVQEENVFESQAKEEEKPAQFRYDSEERELLRMMILYGNILVDTEAEDEEQVTHNMQITLTEFILFELWRDNITFENPIHQVVYEEYTREYATEKIPDLEFLKRSQNPILTTFLYNYVMSPHELSDWRKFGVEVPTEVSNIKKAAQHSLFSLKGKILQRFIDDLQLQLKDLNIDFAPVIKEIQSLNELKKRVNKLLGRVIVY